MALIHDFEKDPPGFLEKFIVVVPMQEEAEATSVPKAFCMTRVHAESNVVKLGFRVGAKANDPNSVPAYWLPWHNGKAVTLTLGSAAGLMFTTELTNCRFSVLTKDLAAPTVAHVAGTGSSGQRDNWEKKAGLPERKSEDNKHMRRFSKTLDKSDLEHLYRGQFDNDDDSSSAFVFGRRVDGVWSFYAQVCEGKMTGTVIDKGAFPKQVKQLGGLHKVA